MEKWSRACNYGQADRGEHPMNCVDWLVAEKFCKWARKRLPTEEEWEYAARGEENRKYPWGSEAPSPGRLKACGAQRAVWDKKNVGLDVQPMFPAPDRWPTTAPVDTFPSGDSASGLHDLAGNVLEWTASRYCPYQVSSCSEQARVVRGGSWLSDQAGMFRAAIRFSYNPEKRLNDVGFRCARTIEGNFSG